MSKFKEGEIVRSVLKGDEKFPFFRVYKPYEGGGYLVMPMSNTTQFLYADIRSENALRHTERDFAGDE